MFYNSTLKFKRWPNPPLHLFEVIINSFFKDLARIVIAYHPGHSLLTSQCLLVVRSYF
jgi:hypothetical protein